MNCSVGLQSSVGNERCLRRLPISAHVSLFNNITGYVCGLHVETGHNYVETANACQGKYVTTTGIHGLSYVPLKMISAFVSRVSRRTVRLHRSTNPSFPLLRSIYSFQQILICFHNLFNDANLSRDGKENESTIEQNFNTVRRTVISR